MGGDVCCFVLFFGLFVGVFGGFFNSQTYLGKFQSHLAICNLTVLALSTHGEIRVEICTQMEVASVKSPNKTRHRR